MIEYLNSIDTAIFSSINGLYCDYFNRVMWLLSGRLTWLLMIVVLLYVLFRNDWKRGLIVVVSIALVILFCDQVSSSLIKPFVHRLRPSHTASLQDSIHLINGYTSGLYGFVSSHAANSFGVAVLISLIFKNKWITTAILLWAAIVCYSRIYVGVHYPGDIVCGAALGALIGWGIFEFIFHITIPKIPKLHFTQFNNTEARQLSVTISLNIIGVLIASCFYVL